MSNAYDRSDDPRDDPDIGDDPNRPMSMRRSDAMTDPRDDPNLVGDPSSGEVPRPDSSPPPDQGPAGPMLPPVLGNFFGNFFGKNRQYADARASPAPAPAAPAARPPNIGLPQGQPPPRWPPTFMPNRRQWYIPQTVRGPGMWGKPRTFPMLPPIWQVPMLLSQLGMQFGQFGPPHLAMLGMGLNRYTLAFMNGMQKGQAQYSRQMREQMDMQRDLLDDQAKKYLDDYERVFREFGDPSKPGGGIPPEKLPAFRAAIEAIASEHHDDHMLRALHNNDVQGVIDQLNWLDAKHGDLRASRRSQEVDDRIRRNQDPIFHEGGATGTGTEAPAAPTGADGEEGERAPPSVERPAAPGPNPLEAAPGEETPAPGEEGEPAPATAPAEAPGPESRATPTQQQAQVPSPQQPQQAGQQQEQQAPDALGQRYPQVAAADNFVPGPTGTAPAARAEAPPIQSQVFDNTQKKHARFGNLERAIVNQDAENSLFAGKYVGPPSKDVPEWASLVRARWGEMSAELNKVMREPPPRTDAERQQYLERIRGISPRLAAAIEGYSKGTVAPPRVGTTAASSGLFSWLTPLAQKYDPTINQNNIAVRKAVRTSFGAGRDGQNLTSIGTAYLHLAQYRADLAEYSKRDYATRLKMRVLGGRDLPDMLRSSEYLSLSDEDRKLVGRLRTDENTSLNEFERAITGGKPTVTGRKHQSDEAGWQQDPETALAAIDNLHKQLEARMEQLHRRYKAYLGPNTGSEGELFEEYARSGRIPPADELGVPESGNDASNKIVREAIKTGRLPPPAPAAAPAPTAAPAPAAPAAAPATPAPQARPPGVPEGAEQTMTRGGKTYYKKDGKWFEAD